MYFKYIPLVNEYYCILLHIAIDRWKDRDIFNDSLLSIVCEIDESNKLQRQILVDGLTMNITYR